MPGDRAREHPLSTEWRVSIQRVAYKIYSHHEVTLWGMRVRVSGLLPYYQSPTYEASWRSEHPHKN